MKKKTKQALSIAAVSSLIGMYICVLVLVTLNVASAEPYKGTYGTSYEERAIIQICEKNRVAASVEPSRVYFDVPLDKDLQNHIMDICEERGIDPRVAFAMIKCESGFRAETTGDGGNSLGLMQIQPRWHYARMERLGCDNLLDPYQNVTVGLDLFGDLLKHYGNGGGSYANEMIAAGQISTYAARVLECAEGL